MSPPKLNLSLFFNQWRQAVLLLEADGTIAYKNPMFSSLFSRELGAQKNTLKKLLEHNPDIFQSIEKVMEQKNSYYLRDVAVNLIGKPTHPMDIEILPLSSDDIGISGIVVVFRDRKAHIRHEEHEKRADRIASFKTMASGLAHEIRNPLSGILGAAQLLASSLDDDEQKELSQIIVEETQRVDRLVSQLMNLSRPRGMQKQPVNINELLHSIVTLHKTSVSKNFLMEESYDPSLPLLQADQSQLKQVFVNLVKNAIEALEDSEHGHIQIRTRIVNDFGVKTREKRTLFLAVDIEDSGLGMTEDQLTKIFVPFFTTKPSGTGLGLPLCYQIVEEHHGDIRVESRPGKTVFSVYLPLG